MINNMHQRHNIQFISFTYLLLLLIGLADWQSGFELTFYIFYMVPLLLLANRTGISNKTVSIASILAGIVTYLADISSGHEYSTVFIPLWNGFVRMAIFLSLALSVSALRRQKELLAEKNEQLKLINEERNTFVGVAAHDLVTPLSAIYSFSEFLLNDSEIKQVSQKRQDILKIINKTSKNSLELVRNLLDLSKINTGVINLNLQSRDYIQFIRRAISVNQVLADQKEIKIALESDLDRIIATFDEVYMREVLDNLLFNAIKYSYANNKVLVRVSKDNSIITTEVIDNGVGIAQNEIEKLFKPFSRSSSMVTSGEKSTGLGLASVKKVIEEHKGYVGIKSQLGKGSTFYFSIPEKLVQDI